MNSSTLRNVVFTVFLTAWQGQHAHDYHVFWILTVFCQDLFMLVHKKESFVWKMLFYLSSVTVELAHIFFLIQLSRLSSFGGISTACVLWKSTMFFMFWWPKTNYCFATCYFTSIIWRLISCEFLCPSSPEFVSSSHKKVNDMRVRESPLPSTNKVSIWGDLELSAGILCFIWTQALPVASHQECVGSWEIPQRSKSKEGVL